LAFIPSNPFVLPGRWLKGNLHTHTTNSDGRKTPQEAVAWYAEAGYDFVALTDHHRIPSAADLTAVPSITVLAGEELNFVDRETGADYHVVCLGCRDTITLPAKVTAMEAVAQATAQAELAFVAHPYWCANEIDDLLRAMPLAGVEVFNTTCEKLNGKGLSVVHWDALLKRGIPAFGFAVDDAHWSSRADYGEAWVCVKAEENQAAAIIAALARGEFYASTGPVIEKVELTERRAYIRCSSAVRIVFAGPGPRGRVICAEPGSTVCEAEYEFPADLRYLRIHVVDSCGRMAWTNPLLFSPA
jgi:predicted metal-dependent phosphoesterase TrpH